MIGLKKNKVSSSSQYILLLFQTILNKKLINNRVGPQILPTLVKRVVHFFSFDIFKYIFHYFHVYKCVRLSHCIS